MRQKQIRLDYQPTSKQRLLHESAVRQIFYGGAAGGGKSHVLRWDAYYACLQNPGLDAYLFRRTQVQLHNTHIKRIAREIPPELGVFKEKKNRIEWHNGSFLNFVYAEAEHDVDNYDSVEFHWLGLDEASHFSNYQLSYLRTRCRLGSYQPVQNIFPRLIMTSNPGNVSHNWLKSKYINPAPPMTVFEDNSMRSKRTGRAWTTIFIPARMIDNPYLDEDYDAAFGDLPDWKQKMLVDGDWDVVPGAFFEPFSRIHNVVPRFNPEPHLTRVMAMDAGFSHPFSIGWYCIMDGETALPNGLILPSGAAVRYREWYGCRYTKEGEPMNQGLRLHPHMIADGIKDRENGEEISYRIAPPDMWKAETGKSVAASMGERGLYFRKADRHRETGWQQLYAMIDGSDPDWDARVPMFYVTDNCTHWIRTVPVLQADESNTDEITGKGRGVEDHCADESRYFVMSRPKIHRKKPRKRRIDDPMTWNDLIRQNERPRGAMPEFRRI